MPEVKETNNVKRKKVAEMKICVGLSRCSSFQGMESAGDRDEMG